MKPEKQCTYECLRADPHFAHKHQYDIVQAFGGTYESAKSDGRREFTRMLNYVKQNKQVKYILVWKLDRFSRTGSNTIGIVSELKDMGVDVVSVTEPYDASTSGGTLQQNMLLLFANFDNENRRERTIFGMKARMKKGLPPGGRLPIGYDRDKNNDKAVHMRRAFEMIETGYKIVDVRDYLKVHGITYDQKNLSKALRNPIYCGVIVNALLDEPAKAN